MSLFIIWKIFTIINLNIGMRNQLGSLRYKEDVALAAITVFSNAHWWCLWTLSLLIRPATEYLYPRAL